MAKQILYCQIFFCRERENKVYIDSILSTFSFLLFIHSSSKIQMPVQRGLAKECQQHFQTSNLYEVFSLNRTATDAQGTIEIISF